MRQALALSKLLDWYVQIQSSEGTGFRVILRKAYSHPITEDLFLEAAKLFLTEIFLK